MNIKSPKLIVLSTLLAAVCAFALPATFAQDAAPDAGAKKEHKVSKKTLEKYDTNKDGKLDDAEMAAMKADKAKQKADKKAKKAEDKADAAAAPAPAAPAASK